MNGSSVFIIYWFFSVEFIIQGLTTSAVPCRGVPDTTIERSTSDDLEDGSYDTCIVPLSQGSDLARITLEVLNHTATVLQVTTAFSKEVPCSTPGVLLTAEAVSDQLVECALGNEDDTNLNIRVCDYTCQCFCKSGCAFIHIHFYNLRALGLNNLHWKLCDVQLCYL